MADGFLPEDEPCYVISVAARMVDLHPQRLRYYDRIGLLRPSRTKGRIRLYSRRDIERLRKIARLTEDLGVNLAGAEVVLNMSRRIEELQAQLARTQEQAEAEINRLRRQVREIEASRQVREEPSIVIEVKPLDSREAGESDQADSTRGGSDA